MQMIATKYKKVTQVIKPILVTPCLSTSSMDVPNPSNSKQYTNIKYFMDVPALLNK